MDENHFYETEVSPIEILKIMKTNVYDNYFKNNYHFISSDYLLSRSLLFSLIRKISNKMCFKSQTYFLSIYYLDILFSKNKKIDCNYKILGLACLLLSEKYIENDPCVPNLSNFIKVYNNVVGYKYIISAADLFYAEVLTCKMLGYKLNYYTIYDFDSFFFGHGIIKIEQLRELNNGIYSNFLNNNFEINSSNSRFIRKILERIYRKSRKYLELIVNNSKICLKYNSLILSIFIMKKSVEEILFEEQRINKHDLLNKEKFLTKTSKYFREIMIELYQIDYESIEEYIELISDKDLIKLLQEEKKNELSPALINLENNIKLANNNNKKSDSKNKIKDYNYENNQNIFPLYSHMSRFNTKINNKSFNNNILTTNLNENQILKKMSITRNLSKNNNYPKLCSKSSYRLSSKNKNNDNSIPKKNHLITNNLDLSNLSSTKELNKIDIKKINNQNLERAQSRHSEINCMKYLQRYTTYNNLGIKRRNDSNSISKKHNKSISLGDNEELLDIIKTLDNAGNININKTIKIESPIKYDNENEYNIAKIKKLNKLNKLQKRVFNGIDPSGKNKDNSISLIDNSYIINNMNISKLADNEINKNYDKYKKIGKPYYRKVIRNTINHDNYNNSNIKSLRHGLSGKTGSVSYLSIHNENMRKKKDYNSIMNNQFPINNNKGKEDKIIDDDIKSIRLETNILSDDKVSYYENDNKSNYTIHSKIRDNISVNKIREKQIANNKMNQNNSLFNIKKNINEIILNEKIGEKEKKKENKENINIKEKNDKNNNGEIKIFKENKQEEINIEDKEINNEMTKYSSSSNFYFNKRKEREKMLLNRIKSININNNNFENKDEKDKINKTTIIINKNEESKDNININDLKKNNNNNLNEKEKKNTELNEIKSYTQSKPEIISKRKYFLSNKKPKQYQSQIKDIINNNSNNNNTNIKNSKNERHEKEINININTNNNLESLNDNNIIKENKCKSIRHKYMNKMHSKNKEKNKQNDTLLINKDKIEKDKNYDIKEVKDTKDDKKSNNDKNNNIIDIKVNKNNKFKDNDYKKRKEKNEEKANINYINKKGLEIKVAENDSKVNYTKNNYPTSSIFKLLHRTKTLTNNNDIELSKEKLNLDLSKNYLYHYNKQKAIRTINHSESKEKNEPKVINKDIMIPKEMSYHTITTDFNKFNSSKNNTINNINNNDRIIHSYHHRNLLKNKIRKNFDFSNQNSNNVSSKNLNLETNNTANTIVINNNININFNNKIEPIQGRYIRNNVLKRNTTDISNNNDYFHKIIFKRTNKNNSHQKAIIEKYNDNINYNKMKGKDNFYKGGTIECININKNNVNNQNNSISSLLHRLPIYKKTLDNNRRVLSRETSIGIKHN